MENILNTFITVGTEVNLTTIFASLLVSIILGIIIAVTYMFTSKKQHSQSFVLTLVMLPIILAMIICFVGSNVARAFSLAGTLSIIRFRSAPGDPKDIGYIFFAIAAGLACGIGVYLYGLIFVTVLCIFMIILHFTNFARPSNKKKLLRITIPEDTDYNSVFNEVFDKYTLNHEVSRVKTTNLGSLFEISYNITLLPNCDEKKFIDDLRCLNGNLTIQISSSPIME